MTTIERQIKIPEAVASVTYSVETPKGFNILFTIRDETEAKLFERMEAIEEFIVEAGYKPQGREVKHPNETSKPEQETIGEDVCPVCGAPLVKFTTKTGKSGVQCSTRKYDFDTKTTTGCEYVKWDNDLEEIPATPAQKKVLEKMGVWKEGTSKSEAMRLISESMGK